MTAVIDFHVHLANYPDITPSAHEWFVQQYPNSSDYEVFSAKYADPANFCRHLQENQVDYAVILAEVAPLTTGTANNRTVLEFCHGRESLIPFCTFNPYLDPRMADTLEQLVCEQGVRGIKLYPTYNYFYPNEAMLYPLYAAAERLDIPVLFHTGSSVFENARIKYGNPIYFDDVAVDFPRLKLVMAHGGRGVWYGEAMLMARLHKNVYVEVSGLPPQKLLEYFPEMDRFAHKFIFGSDWPSVNLAKNIATIRSLPLSEKSKERILGGNAAELLKLA